MLTFVDVMSEDYEIEDSDLNENLEIEQVLRPKLFAGRAPF